MVSVNMRLLVLVLIPVFLAGCGGTMNDLNPSNSDKQATVQSGTVGSHVGQKAPDFTISDTLGTSVNLSSVLTGTGVTGVVLYFTMWCPTCDIHMSSMRSSHIPNFPNVRFFAVDYVSGTVAEARDSEISNGYSGSGFTVLVDTDKTVQNLYYPTTMGTTIVIDKTGVIRMNEDYKDDRLTTALTSLL